MTVAEDRREALAVLEAWNIAPTEIERIYAGHINLTFKVTSGKTFALQRLADIFDPAMHNDIEFVTAGLAEAGMLTPRLVPAGKRLWIEDDRGRVWRMLTWIAGEVMLTVDGPDRCREAGGLLGRFHRALWNSEHVFEAARIGVHDTAAHLARLEKALDSWHGHRHYGAIAELGEQILETAGKWAFDWAGLPERIVHGDPKISNVIFDQAGRALCLIDLDTLGRMPLACDLGDAFRSWCQPFGEDSSGPFEIAFFEAGISGWAEALGGLPGLDERESIATAVRAIAVELASRFCLDAFEESYFGWNETRFKSASEHNQARARSQLGLARSIDGQLARMQSIVATAFREG
ncbi:MAG TPA: aminoglycoside phosphotransferase family protein [Myxococcota bacterium]|nr:aminoglycoside phosphotransferase family protein [Myxococcota bacterium]